MEGAGSRIEHYLDSEGILGSMPDAPFTTRGPNASNRTVIPSATDLAWNLKHLLSWWGKRARSRSHFFRLLCCCAGE